MTGSPDDVRARLLDRWDSPLQSALRAEHRRRGRRLTHAEADAVEAAVTADPPRCPTCGQRVP